MTAVPSSTIVAIATPPGIGGVGVIRISGPAVPDIARAMLGRLPPARVATYSAFKDKEGRPLDSGIALYFPAPHSFTGEAVLELQGHGGPVVLDMVVTRVLELGAKPARPGEFSERAFHHGKIDLAQAEAFADLIASGSAAAARSAIKSLQGEFSNRIHDITNQLIDLRAYVEAAIDFPDEEIDFLADASVLSRLDEIDAALVQLLASAQQGRLLHEGMTVVLAGRPNAGKSSLLNRLTRQESAIVSAVPGTTRDIVREFIHIDGLPLHILDTAGIRDSEDDVEAEGVRRAQQAMDQADCILVVLDDSKAERPEELSPSLPVRPSRIVIYNKCDISGRSIGEVDTLPGVNALALSAKTGEGIDELRGLLKQLMGYRESDDTVFMARRRHLDAIERARQSLSSGRAQLETARAGELLAEDLRQAQLALSEITGEFTQEDLLGKIFSDFCIGK